MNFLGLMPAKKISYLNFDEYVQEQQANINNEFTIALIISDKFTIQKRIVYDIFEMLGDVGGLHDFLLIIILSSFFGTFSQNFMVTSIEKKVFHAATIPGRLGNPPNTVLSSIKPIALPEYFSLCRACVAHERKKHMILMAACVKLEKSLDIERLMGVGER